MLKHLKINWLFIFHIFTHIAAVLMILYAQPIHYLWALLVYFFVGSIGGSGTYHRLLSHKSYDAPRWWVYFGTLCGTLGGMGSSVTWASFHREHHRFSDTDQDPVNVRKHGFFKVQFLSMFHNPKARYVPDLLRDKFHMNMHNYYWGIHAAYATILYLIDPFALIYAWLFPCFINWHALGFVATLSHTIGTRDYISKDLSTNHWFTGIFVWGEGWHNNHHANPGNMRYGEKWYELDVTYYVLRLLGFKQR